MDCVYCNGVDTVEEQLTRFCACETSQPFIVENVPAFVCRICGDKSFSGDTVMTFEKMKNGEVQTSSLQFLRVFNFQRQDKAKTPVSWGINLRAMADQGLNENGAIFYGAMGISQQWANSSVNLKSLLFEGHHEWDNLAIQPIEARQVHPYIDFTNVVNMPKSYSYRV